MTYNLIFTAFLSFFMIKFIIIYAKNLNLIDKPNERSAHTKNIPLGAGIGFISAMILGLATYDISIIINYWYIFISIFIVLFIGMLDDIYFANPKMKIYTISIAVIILWLNDIGIDSLGTYLGSEITLGYLSLPFTLFALVTFANSLNLIDGIDGLAALVSLVIISFFGYIGYQHSNELMTLISLFIITSLSVFIILNYHPAKIFMGDSGSLTLGFIIAILAILSLQYIHPVVVLYLTALPIYDTLNVVARRLIKGNHIFQPDTTHAHHILLRFIGDKDKNGNIINGNKRTVWILVVFQFTFSVIGLQIHNQINTNDILSIFALLTFILIFFFIYFLFTKIEKVR